VTFPILLSIGENLTNFRVVHCYESLTESLFISLGALRQIANEHFQLEEEEEQAHLLAS
jgi:hypothetical protein